LSSKRCFTKTAAAKTKGFPFKDQSASMEVGQGLHLFGEEAAALEMDL
jgi:hypothetical protein